MAKHFKLRIYRAIIGSLQSCRSTDPSDLPENPVPLLSNGQTHTRRRRAFAAGESVHAGKQTFDAGGVVFEPIKHRGTVCSSPEHHAPPPVKNKRTRVKKIKKKGNAQFRASTSSAESAWFSSAAEETETPVSYTDSSAKSRRKRRVFKIPRRSVSWSPAAGGEIPARLSVFKKLIPCSVEGKVKESFAVMKRSEDPYEDFKNSMLDMILEKEMFDREDLEQLLECFLSLNSRRYHGVIVQAFSEVWDAVFARWSDSKFPVRDCRRMNSGD